MTCNQKKNRVLTLERWSPESCSVLRTISANGVAGGIEPELTVQDAHATRRSARMGSDSSTVVARLQRLRQQGGKKLGMVRLYVVEHR